MTSNTNNNNTVIVFNNSNYLHVILYSLKNCVRVMIRYR